MYTLKCSTVKLFVSSVLCFVIFGIFGHLKKKNDKDFNLKCFISCERKFDKSRIIPAHILLYVNCVRIIKIIVELLAELCRRIVFSYTLGNLQVARSNLLNLLLSNDYFDKYLSRNLQIRQLIIIDEIVTYIFNFIEICIFTSLNLKETSFNF